MQVIPCSSETEEKKCTACFLAILTVSHQLQQQHPIGLAVRCYDQLSDPTWMVSYISHLSFEHQWKFSGNIKIPAFCYFLIHLFIVLFSIDPVPKLCQGAL